VVRSAVRSGLFVGDPFTIAFAIWSTVHGVVSLFLARCAPDDESETSALFQAAAAAAVRGSLARPAA
jgi:hypothetical protein